jgi:hypothetical protein
MALIRRASGQRTVNLSTPEKIKRLWAAAHALYAHDPEHFKGGCADISIALYFAAARANWTGVQVVAGSADPIVECPVCAGDKMRACWGCTGDDDECDVCQGSGEILCEDCEGAGKQYPDGGWHVWLLVDGEVLDPTWALHQDITGTQYHPEATGRAGLRLAAERHGCEMMLESRSGMIYYTDPAMPALRGGV